ncbi:MAG: sporulation initiation factor Spo0A C-terminal domain-containing protein [Oscillospiraceae bacterium]|nr:sporulation initiation factor Spo0A C-terminal domain-containing protein [Oscillospiraceae bacterium]
MSMLEQQVNALMRLCTAEKESEKAKIREELRRLIVSRAALSAPDPEYLVRQLLLELGSPDHLLGHPYVVEAVLLVLHDQMYINNITFGLYPQLAAKFDTTAARVERAIRHLVEVTWARGDWDVLEHYFGNTISPDRGKPTNGEFIARLTNIIRQKLKKAA